MKNYSLKTRIICITFLISLIVPAVSYYVVSRNSQTSKIYQDIANITLNRVEASGEMLSNFRQIRVDVRSIGLINNTKTDIQKYMTATSAAVEQFEKSKSKLEALLSTEVEKKKFQEMDLAWQDFLNFGKGLLVLAEKGDQSSFDKIAEDVRLICPVKKEGVEKHIREFIEIQKLESSQMVALARASESETARYALLGTIAGLMAAIGIGFYFASSVSKSLEESIQSMLGAVNQLNMKSTETSDVSQKISRSSVQQASSLQQTVSAIDEISAMVSRNADSASCAAVSSDETTRSVQNGKVRVEDMLSSIKAIANGNEEFVKQMQSSNKEISDIVLVIEEISRKTQVINDIVFQTKLLSFNASVEAARAGDHGKGFAVVAEEVGNLASMSGKAANEISSLLTDSVAKVSEIVESSREIMNRVVEQSKIKVDHGTKTAHDCAKALDEISNKISSMSVMVKEISVASQEQSTGIREVNMAMSHLDEMTQVNTEVAKSASATASDLKLEADNLQAIVSQLTVLVRGGSDAKERGQVDILKPAGTPLKPRIVPAVDDVNFG